MAQFKVGDKVSWGSIKEAKTGVIESWNELHMCWNVKVGDGWTHIVPECGLAHCEPTTITATLTTETIPTELLKQLSEAGFLITIKAI